MPYVIRIQRIPYCDDLAATYNGVTRIMRIMNDSLDENGVPLHITTFHLPEGVLEINIWPGSHCVSGTLLPAGDEGNDVDVECELCPNSDEGI